MDNIARLRIIAGPNGSGKTTLTTNLRRIIPFGYIINADAFEKELSLTGRLSFAKYQLTLNREKLLQHFKTCTQLRKYVDSQVFISEIKIFSKSVRVPAVHINSYVAASIADYLRAEFISRRISFTFETVMSHGSKIAIMEQARQQGYRIYLYYISTENPLINVERVKQRVQEAGHNVTRGKIEERYFKSLKLLYQAIKASDRCYLFDNSITLQWFAEITSGKQVEYKQEVTPQWYVDYVVNHP